MRCSSDELTDFDPVEEAELVEFALKGSDAFGSEEFGGETGRADIDSEHFHGGFGGGHVAIRGEDLDELDGAELMGSGGFEIAAMVGIHDVEIDRSGEVEAGSDGTTGTQGE